MHKRKDKMIRGSQHFRLNRTMRPVCNAHKEYDPATYGEPLYECVFCKDAWEQWKKQKGVVEK